jgi:hypothetical protein
MSDDLQMSMAGSSLRDGKEETLGAVDDDDRGQDQATRAFQKAQSARNAKPIDSLDKIRWRRHPKESIALLPADVEVATATVKLRARDQDVRLKRLLALFAVVAVGFQLLVADLILMPWIILGQAAPSDAVLIAWMSATVVEVIGIVAIVARNLFPGKRRKRRRKTT